MMVGISKTGIPGLSLLSVPLIVMVLPARLAVGIALGIRILADLFSASYYRRHANWDHIIRLLPPVFAGIIVGFFGLKIINDQQLRPVIGIIVLLMLVMDYLRSRYANDNSTELKIQWWFSIIMGFFAGVATMMANAAGPIMIIYFLAMRFSKTELVGTLAWLFFIVNWIKVPFSASLELMTLETIKLNFILLPFIALGAITGIFVLKKIPQKAFGIIVRVLAIVAALRLLF
jgi:hypothetical protein